MAANELERTRGDGLPTFSVIIASNREPARIRSCLEALAEQEYPPEKLEAVVVDDGSPAPLAPVVAEVGETMRVRVHEQRNAGPAAARNAGARLATGDLLAFTDDDCAPATDWLTRLSDVLGEHPEALVGGRLLNALEHDRFAEATHSLIAYLYEAHGRESPRRFFTSSNMALSRTSFDAAGGFDESFRLPGGEDRELCERWRSQGRPLVYAPHAVVWHAHGLTLRSFVRQHANYGRGAYGLRRRRREGSAGPGLEPLAFYARLVSDPFRRLPFGRALAQSFLLSVMQVATAAGYVHEWHRSRSRAESSAGART